MCPLQRFPHCHYCSMMPRLRFQQTGSANYCTRFLIFSPGWLPPIRTCCQLVVTALFVLCSYPSFIDLEIRFGLARIVRMAALVDELQTIKLRNVQVRRVPCRFCKYISYIRLPILEAVYMGSRFEHFLICFAANGCFTTCFDFSYPMMSLLLV